jgi:glycosyltransferase involved in cell wall biosynthesis
MPKISVIISTYNDAALLPKAIDSVLAQSFGDFELLVFNDASTDNTELILKDYQKKDSRIIITGNKITLGLTANLNAGIHQAMGEYIARIDSDDEWIGTNKLQKQLDFLEANPKVGLVGTWAEFTAMDGKKLYDFKPPTEDARIRKQLLLRNCFVHSSIMARRSLVIQAGSYSPIEQYVEDYGLWLRLGRVSGLANLPQIMVRYRVNPSGITRTKNLAQAKAALSLIKRQKNNYPGFLKAWVKWIVQIFIAS